MGKFPCFGSTLCYLYDILEFVAEFKQEKIPFDSFFIVVIITELMMESRKFVTALKYMHFFEKKVLTGELSLVRKFYSWKSKIYGHEAEHRKFPLFQSKVI